MSCPELRTQWFATNADKLHSQSLLVCHFAFKLESLLQKTYVWTVIFYVVITLECDTPIVEALVHAQPFLVSREIVSAIEKAITAKHWQYSQHYTVGRIDAVAMFHLGRARLDVVLRNPSIEFTVKPVDSHVVTFKAILGPSQRTVQDNNVYGIVQWIDAVLKQV
jgi:hypothetical protein